MLHGILQEIKLIVAYIQNCSQLANYISLLMSTAHTNHPKNVKCTYMSLFPCGISLVYSLPLLPIHQHSNINRQSNHALFGTVTTVAMTN